MTFHAAPLIDSLTDRFSQVEGALCDSKITAVSLTLACPDLPFRGLPTGLGDFLYWARPGEDHHLLGVDTAMLCTAQGVRRFEELGAKLSTAKDSWFHTDPDGTGFSPILFSGFAFAPGNGSASLPNASLRLPLATLQRKEMARALTFSWHKERGTDTALILDEWKRAARQLVQAVVRPLAPPPAANSLHRLKVKPDDDAWLKRVGKAVDAIQSGVMEKVVLTRRLKVAAPRRFDPARLMTILSYRYPGCVLLAQADKQGVAVAATPERLVGLKDGQVSSDALAGTLRRDPEEAKDQMLGAALKQSAKDLHEHRLVVDQIIRRLSPLCTGIKAATAPRLLQLRSLQHLWTPVTAVAKPGVNLLDLAANLHPTPAVGGVPREAALAWLAENEEERFGWYTGAFGWMTPSGDGDLSVVLRCAYLHDVYAELSAGAGIVADSNPMSELEETDLKFQAMLEALEDA